MTDEASGIQEIERQECTPRVTLFLAAIFAFDFLLAAVLITVGLYFFFRHLINQI